jgi:hypothetical protein
LTLSIRALRPQMEILGSEGLREAEPIPDGPGAALENHYLLSIFSLFWRPNFISAFKLLSGGLPPGTP